MWLRDTKPAIVQNYIDEGKVKLVFMDYAFLGRDSMKAAQASYCADDQGMYWEYHTLLYNSQQDEIDGGWASLSNLRDFVLDLDLDLDAFNECMSEQAHALRIDNNIRIAQDLGIRSTPTFFIVGPEEAEEEPVMVMGAQPFSVFQRIIDGS